MQRHLLVGLGNPAATLTRHSVGADFVRYLAARRGLALDPCPASKGHCASSSAATLFVPDTFMNLSGASVAAAMQRFQVPAKRLIVVHDSIEHGFGQVALKHGGSERGHNGLRSVSKRIGTRSYGRLRFGVGKPIDDVAAYVLSRFEPHEQQQLAALFDEMEEMIRVYLEPT